MESFHLGFVGGCLTHQAGVPFPRLFHRVLARQFADDHGVRLTLAVNGDYTEEPGRRVARLLRDERPDAVLLHRSTNTFFPKAMAVFVGDDSRYIVNPFLLRRRRRRSWLDEEREGFRRCLAVWRAGRAPTTTDVRADGSRTEATVPPAALVLAHAAAARRRFGAGDFAWIVADWTGLTEWAITDELRIVHESSVECAAAGVPLIVLGPGLRIGMPRVDRCSRRLDRRLASCAACDGGFTYVSLLAPLPGSQEPQPVGVHHHLDVIHLNAAGHAFVAARLEPHLLPLVGARHRSSRPHTPA